MITAQFLRVVTANKTALVAALALTVTAIPAAQAVDTSTNAVISTTFEQQVSKLNMPSKQAEQQLTEREKRAAYWERYWEQRARDGQ